MKTQLDRAPHENSDRGTRQRDGGFTLIEMILVVVILGVMGSVTVMSVGGLSTEAADTGCLADRHQLGVSAEAYFAQTGVDQIPETGTDHDRFERTLVDAEFMRSVSTMHDLDADGRVTPEENSSC